MKREKLNFEPFYYVEPMRIIDDPMESFKELMKFDEEKTEIENYLKHCTLKDFIWVIVAIFKNEYADGALLSSFISKTITKEKKTDGVLYFKETQYRKDLKSLKFKYNIEDHFEYLEFEFVNPFAQITNTVEEYLIGKNYSKNGDKYTVNSDSGIEYIEATPTFFKLKANMKKSKRFH
ncbi:hypothetical protein [Chryseobacterium echinoideorum]|uniref:hypothetical protein n=1 Tax=Chryseobacterium echinoideorum TaxID=1549648 RepID=UPI001186F657|nr:hypothetical protein [Chryseobacterium echinoideorum]